MKSSIHVGAIWITLYFFANLALTIHNKWVLDRLDFNFPWSLTALHILLTGLGSYLIVLYLGIEPPFPLQKEDHLILSAFSLLYTINIAISNVSLKYVSLSFHQIVRSTNPVFTVLLEFIFLGHLSSLWIILSLLPVVFGVIFATVSEYASVSFSMLGLCLTVFGVFLAAVKGIITNQLMVGSLKLHPLDLLWRMTPLCVLQCLIYAYGFGEFQGLCLFFEAHPFFASHQNATLAIVLPTSSPSLSTFFSFSVSPSLIVYIQLFLNGLMAFFLNWVSFTANKKTSALTMTVAGNVKQAMSILFAMYIFTTPLTTMNVLGILMTLVGGALYR